MVVQINKKGNPSQLRLLFPTIQFAKDGIPVYSHVVYSDFEYELSESALLLVQSPSGFAVDTQNGLCAFLSKIGYMAPSKIERLKSVQSFGEKELVYAMYHEAITLKIANRSYLNPENTEYSVVSLLQLPLYERIQKALTVGPTEVLTRVLTTLEKFYTHDSTLSAHQYSELAQCFVGFNTMEFKKTFRITGNDETDCLLLLTLLPVRSTQ